MAEENCWNCTVQPWLFSKLFSTSESFIGRPFLWILPIQAHAGFTRVSMWPSGTPAVRWTTAVNKATGNFTINYFKSRNLLKYLTVSRRPFRILWELTLHSWKRHKYYCQIKYLLHVSVRKLALSTFSKIWCIKMSQRDTVVRKFQRQGTKWLMLQHQNCASADTSTETCKDLLQNAKSIWDKIPVEMQMWSCFDCHHRRLTAQGAGSQCQH